MTITFIPLKERLGWQIEAMDLNRDGIKDFLVFENSTNKLIAVTSNGSDSWVENEQLFVGGNPTIAQTPQVLFEDLNGDGYKDLVVYGLGPLTNGKFQGSEPLLYLGSSLGTYTKSNLLGATYQSMISQSASKSYNWYQDNLTVSAKSIAAADINRDGSIDLWIESSGGWNASGHFLINSSNGFTPTQSPIGSFDYWGPNYVGWRYSVSKFIDLNQDGAPDLVMGQMRAHSWQIDATSKIFLNNGNGAFSTSNIIHLPAPAFNDGWSKVVDLASGDINRDGLNDLVLLHTRYGSTTPEYTATSWIGTYLQILTKNKNGSFTDESWRLGDQTAWSTSANVTDRYAETVQLLDVNLDGKFDIVLGYPWKISPNNSDCPLVFTQSQYGTFAPVDSSYFTQGNSSGAKSVIATDLTGNGNIGFVSIGSTSNAQGLSINTLNVTALTSTHTISRVIIDGKTIALDIDGIAGQAYRIYKAAFNRTPDNGGLKYWIQQMDGGKKLSEVASGFIASNEFKSLYGANPTSDQFVAKLYNNVLGRAPDAGGFNYWVGLLNNKQIDMTSTLVNFSESTENQAGVIGVIQNGIELLN